MAKIKKKIAKAIPKAIAKEKKEIKITELKSKTKIIREIKSGDSEAENKNQNLEQELSHLESSSLSEFISSGRIIPTLHTGQEGAVRTGNETFGSGSRRQEEEKEENVSYFGKSEQEKRNYSSSEATITSSGMNSNNLANSRENGFGNTNTLQRSDFNANRMNTEVNEREEKKYELAEEKADSSLEVKRKRWN